MSRVIRKPEDLPVETCYCLTLEDWGWSCVSFIVDEIRHPRTYYRSGDFCVFGVREVAQELVLVRHGYIGAHYDERFVGSTDVPLTDEGLMQASSLVTQAKALTSAKCFCSPMLRARETADAMLKPVGFTYDIDPNLREACFGRWECMTFEQISASDPENVSTWAEYSMDFSFPGGENARSFATRVQDFAKRAAAEPARTVLAVTHGGVIRALICHFLGLDPRNYLLFDVKPASISRIAIHDGKGVLTQLNDLCHLGECQHG